ncbi:MAG: OsmC family protein [Pyrinomonadaceae bacterium]
MENDIVKATIDQVNYTTVIETASHIIKADEPSTLGGSDEGMTPGQLLLASLGACTAVTLKMYVNRKHWDVGRIRVELSLHTDKEQNITSIERHILFPSAVTSEQKQRLLQIANACPLHRILTGQIVIHTSEATDA